MTERKVLGGELEPCGTDPMTGFFRDRCCRTAPADLESGAWHERHADLLARAEMDLGYRLLVA